MKIRPATLNDIAAIRMCLRQAYDIYIPRIGADAPPFQTDFEQLVAGGNVHVMAATRGIAAFIVSYPVGHTLRIENLAVSPRHQGRGLGGRLLRFAEARAVQLELGVVDLFTHPKLTETIEFYAHYGYSCQTHEVADKAVHCSKIL